MFKPERGVSPEKKLEVAELVMKDFELFSKIVRSKFGKDATKCSDLERSFFANLSLSNPDAYAKFRGTFPIFPGYLDLSTVDAMNREDCRVSADDSDFNEVMNDVRNVLSSEKTTSN